MTSRLFSPLMLRSVELRNRIIVSPMCQYSAVHGVPRDWHLVHLGSRATGGAGMVIAEATAVVPEGRITPSDTGLWNDEQTEAWLPITRFIREQGSIPTVQLAHAGRKASTDSPWNGGSFLTCDRGGWQTVGPSAISFGLDCGVPRAMTEAEIAEVVLRFVESADRARKAGFDAVELHMAHGYLLHEFLSPLSNHRRDAYGGSLENRMRLPLAVAREVRRRWPAHLPLLVRISATDWKDGGWDLPQSVAFCRELKAVGVDLIDTSTGGLVPDAVIPASPGFQVPFAREIRAELGIATGAVGLIIEPAEAEKILTQGSADAILIGRESLRDPYWPLHAAMKLGVDTDWPRQYRRAKPVR